MVSVAGDSAFGIVIAILVLAVLIFNVVYINGVRNELSRPGATLNLSRTGADIIFFIDIILIIVVGIYLIYNIWMIATSHEHRVAVTETITRPRAGVVRKTTVTPIPETTAQAVARQDVVGTTQL